MSKTTFRISAEAGGFSIPQDSCIQVAMLGDFPNTDAGIIQHIDEDSLAKMLANFTTDSQTPNWPGMLVDYDHFAMMRDKPTGAAAWIMRLERRGKDELWGEFRFTEEGRKQVEGGMYRLTSAVYGGFEKYDGAPTEKHLRPTRLLGVSMTNDPNIKGLPPASNRGTANNNTTTEKEKVMADTTTAPAAETHKHTKLLCELLGLTEGASDEDIEKAIAVLREDVEKDAGPDPDDDGDEGTHPAALNREPDERDEQIVALNREIAETRAEQFYPLVQDTDEVKGALIELLATNRSAAMIVLGGLRKDAKPVETAANRAPEVKPDDKPAAKPDVTVPVKPAFNRRFQPVPGGKEHEAGANPDQDAEAVAVKVRLRAEEIFAANRGRGMTYDGAWRIAEREIVGPAKEPTPAPTNGE